MNTLDLDDLKKVTAQAQKLQVIANDLMPFFKLVKELSGEDVLQMPTDRLIRAGDAAKILGVGKATISRYVEEGLLKPVYPPHCNHRKFWLSHVKALPKPEVTKHER